jgi:uncharacterized LabA/DUF88 family protein
MKHVGIYLDIANLFYSARAKYGGAYKLDYAKYMTFVQDLGNIVTARAYGSQMDHEADSFIGRLSELGITPIYEKTKAIKLRDGTVKHKFCWSVGIAVEVIRDMPGIDLVVLGSGNGDMIPLVKYLMENRKQVLILACSISKDLAAIEGLTICEIPKSMFEVGRG